VLRTGRGQLNSIGRIRGRLKSALIQMLDIATSSSRTLREIVAPSGGSRSEILAAQLKLWRMRK
jgi:hypothetical protein